MLLDENSAQLLLQTNEIETLRKQLTDAKTECTKIQDLESKNNEFIKQCKIHDQTISTLQNDLVAKNVLLKKIEKDLEKLGIDWPSNDDEATIDLSVENVIEKLMRNADNWKIWRDVCGRDSEIGASPSCLLCQKSVDGSATECEADLVHHTEEVLSTVSAEWKEQCDQLANENEALSAENARLQVDVSMLESNITSLNKQHVALQLANSQLASEKDALSKQLDNVERHHKALLADQNQMQTLHDQLNADYELLTNENSKLKSQLRDQRNDNRNHSEEQQSLKRQVVELETSMGTMKKENENFMSLRNEHSKLKDDFRSLFNTSERFKNEYKSIQEQYKLLRAENARLNLQNTELNGDISIRTDAVKSLEIELTKEQNRCEMLLQMNANLDIDRRALMDHVSQLLTQYHELLAHSLDDKQHYHDEEKQFTDRVNNLHRQKEKLEEKIMEFYRKIESNSQKK